MASAPQNVTRIAPMAVPAPPARAAEAPRIARNATEAQPTNAIRLVSGATAATSKGNAAPTAKLAAEGERGLNGSRALPLGDAQFIAGVGTQRIMCHELVGDLSRQPRFESAPDIDRRQFVAFPRVIRLEFLALALDVRFLGVRLRVNGYVFASRHGHGAGNQSGHARDHDAVVGRMGPRRTPSTRLAVETMPSLAPSTAARSQPMFPVR